MDYPIISSDELLIENSHERRVRSPLVQSHGTPNSFCVFDDDQNNWCLISNGDMMKVGWEITQSTVKVTGSTDGTYSIAFKPYLKSAISLVSKLIMDLLINKEDTLTYPEFTVKAFYQMLFITSG